MFKITDNLIELTRGDKATIELTIEDYTFQEGDEILFKVYNKKALDKEPLLVNTTIATEGAESVDIVLTSEETKIGQLSNKPIEYWYEIELNGNTTIIGYDDKGAKRLRLYPEGVDD